jgi:hypothetical protein
VASFWRDPVVLTFVDEDNQELGQVTNPAVVPRVGENVRLHRTPYLVDRVGYDVRDRAIERIWIVCRRA